MGGRNINCKKKWHPSRHETRARVEAAEREHASVERRVAASLARQGAQRGSEDGPRRMAWMQPEFCRGGRGDLESRFEK